jgi:hypothetical protein
MGKISEIFFFELARIVIEEIVNPDHLVARRQQPFREMRPYKTGDSGNQRFHR